MPETDRRGSVDKPGLVVVELHGMLGSAAVRGEREDRVNRGDRDLHPAVDQAGQVRAPPGQDEPQARGREVQRHAEVAVRRDHVPRRPRPRVAAAAVAIAARRGGGDGEVGGEDLVQEGGGGEAGRERDGDGGRGGLDEVGVDVLGLVAAVEGEVLEEGVGRERGGEEARREEGGRVGEDRGLGAREDEGELGLRRRHGGRRPSTSRSTGPIRSNTSLAWSS